MDLRAWLKGFVFVLAALAIAGCKKKSDDIVVGHFASMTGQNATFGQSTDNGIKLAIEERNASMAAHCAQEDELQLRAACDRQVPPPRERGARPRAGLSEIGRLPLLGSLELDHGGPTGEPGGNSAFRLAGVWERIVVGPRLAAALAAVDGPVLLVDDLVSSRWTLTVAGRALRLAGAAGVLPFALAVDG